MEDFLGSLPAQDYEDLLDYAKLEDLEEISKRLRHGLLPDLDISSQTKNAQQIEADQRDDARLEAISQRQKELAAEMDENETRLSEIRKINVQSDPKLGQKAKEENMMLRKEDRRKEKQFIEEAENEREGWSRTQNYDFWQKSDFAAQKSEKNMFKDGRLSRKEHFFRDRHSQTMHSRPDPWTEKSLSTRHPHKGSQVKIKAREGRNGNSKKKQSYIIVDQVGMLD